MQAEITAADCYKFSNGKAIYGSGTRFFEEQVTPDPNANPTPNPEPNPHPNLNPNPYPHPHPNPTLHQVNGKTREPGQVNNFLIFPWLLPTPFCQLLTAYYLLLLLPTFCLLLTTYYVSPYR